MECGRTIGFGVRRTSEQDGSPPPITICIPAFQSESWIEETIHSLESQTFQHFKVLVSVDGHDLATFEKWARLCQNPRYTLHLQMKRLGWVGNTNWLLRAASTPFVSILPQDDQFHPLYLELLYKHLLAHPQCLLVYSDTRLIGPDPSFRGRYFVHSSLKGPPIRRMEKYLLSHLTAVAFRGLFLRSALEVAGFIPETQPNHFAADAIWIGEIVRHGEIHRIAAPLCTKRYHANNTHKEWFEKSKEELSYAWKGACDALLHRFLNDVHPPIDQAKLRKAAEFRFQRGCRKFGIYEKKPICTKRLPPVGGMSS